MFNMQQVEMARLICCVAYLYFPYRGYNTIAADVETPLLTAVHASSSKHLQHTPASWLSSFHLHVLLLTFPVREARCRSGSFPRLRRPRMKRPYSYTEVKVTFEATSVGRSIVSFRNMQRRNSRRCSTRSSITLSV